jgi:transcriptional/translational regulatory protein YebC/TACO1
LFDHKGVIEAKPPENFTLETAVEHAIEVGAEEVDDMEDSDDNTLQVCVAVIQTYRLPAYSILMIVFCTPLL